MHERLPNSALELRQLDRNDAEALGSFFAALSANGDAGFFEPHPLTRDEAEKLCRYTGNDLYVVALAADDIVGYGLLRGWDEGYAVPSLGIAIHPRARGLRLGVAMMEYLHSLAKYRGASCVRLRVHSENYRAIQLYRNLGYIFDPAKGDYLVGKLDLRLGRGGPP